MSESVQTKKCPYCAEMINADAIKCKHCGEILDPVLKEARRQQTPPTVVVQDQRKWSPGVAALLSFIFPGAGQIYKGNVGSGLAWLAVVVLGYILLVIPGVVLHIMCIVAASKGDPYK